MANQFHLNTITVTLGHYIRISVQVILQRMHTIWDSANPVTYLNGAQDSLQPNIYIYLFNSIVT
jgi:hypothetical protein